MPAMRGFGVKHPVSWAGIFVSTADPSSAGGQQPITSPMGDDIDRRAARHTRVTKIVATALAVTCTFGAAAAAAGGVATGSDARDAEATADSTEIIQIRSGLRRAHLGELNTMALREFGEASQQEVGLARAERERVRAEAVVELARISDGFGSVALEATSLLEMLAKDGLDTTADPVPMKIAETAWSSAHAHRPPNGALPDRTLGLYDLMITDVTGAGILNDGIDAEYVLRELDVTASIQPYFAESEAYIRSDGGYLGPDGAQPLVDSYVFQPSAQQPHPAVATISGLVANSGLWAYDQWIRSWQQGTPSAAPPFRIDKLEELTRQLDADVYAVIDEVLQREADARAAEASSAQAWSMTLLGLAGLLILVPIGIVARTVRRRLRAVTSVAAQASIDPLTGAGNRHQLHTDTEAYVANPAHVWHLVAAVDMDRFKMINDTWGHAVGDQVLTEVATRLSTVVAGWRGSAAGTAGSVVRIGGDEFLLTLHAPARVNVDIVREQLDEIRNSSITIARDGEPDEQVQLSFSVGIATADSPVALDDLMRIADLAAYEEKAGRAQALPDRRRPVLAPVPES